MTVSAISDLKAPISNCLVQSYQMILKIIYDNLPPLNNVWMRKLKAVVNERLFKLAHEQILKEIRQKKSNKEEVFIRKEATFRFLKRRNLQLVNQLIELGVDFENYIQVSLPDIQTHVKARSEDSISSLREMVSKYVDDLERQQIL